MTSDDLTRSLREMCDMFEVTPRTLRFYEAQGLLEPERDGQRRLYHGRDAARLKLILRGKRFGFSLAEIRELLDLYDLGDGQVTQLSQTLQTAYVKREELHSRRRELDAAIDDLDGQIRLVERMLAERNAQTEAQLKA